MYPIFCEHRNTISPCFFKFRFLSHFLFLKEIKTLLAYSSSKESKTYVVPDTVTSIKNGAFGGNESPQGKPSGIEDSTLEYSHMRETNPRTPAVTAPRGAVLTAEGYAPNKTSSFFNIY